MNCTAFVEQKKREARLANIEEVRKDIKAPWVQEKISNHIAAFDGIMTREEIEEGILNNIIIASKFCKDPGKQNISEKLAAEVLGLNKLPASGKNCIRFNDSGEIVSNSVGSTKSADFKINDYYVTQKYTNEEGGAQDNQRNDVIDFLKKGSLKHKVAALVDGSYWDKHISDLYTEFKNNPNVWITSVTEITENKNI